MTERRKLFHAALIKQRNKWQAQSKAEATARVVPCSSKYKYVRRYGKRWQAENPKASMPFGRFDTEEEAAVALAAFLKVPVENLLRTNCPNGRDWS